MDEPKPKSTRTKKTPQKKVGIPTVILNKLREQLQKLNPNYKLVVEDGENRISIFYGEISIAGPFVHGNSAESWLDGYEACKSELEKSEKNKKHIYILRTGNLYHPYHLVEEKWEHLANGIGAMSMGSAIQVAVAKFDLTEGGYTDFHVTYENRPVIQTN